MYILTAILIHILTPYFRPTLALNDNVHIPLELVNLRSSE